jgi:hypothetical protein
MKTSCLVATLALSAAFSAQAAPMDAKGLARFEAGYAKCEQKFEYMRGHADEAYLGLWKIKADEKGLARLAALRKKPAYQKEKQAAVKAMEKPTPEVEGKLNQQCQATWAQAGVVPAGAASSVKK